MFTDKPQPIEFIADKRFIDQIVDWFGRDIVIEPLNENQVRVEIKASVLAMEHWAKQYLGAVEILKPVELREKIKDSLIEAIEKYK